ncbi:MAG: hypothetical protein ACMVY4_13035 [Minwuia sp.]|uniref:hypothetical protein n=1 Tax=Minwuia sp. TaxID=2493630 RepID=UPI003A8A3CF2
MRIARMVFLTGMLCTSAFAALANDALVQSADPATGLQPFQFLQQGERIDLAGGLSVVLGYPASCVEENITGGTVTVGSAESRIDSGKVERLKLECVTRVQLSNGERQESGASAWRDPNSMQPVLLDNLTPLLRFSALPDRLIIERTDRPSDPVTLESPGTAIDFAERGIVLEAGGIYVMRAGDRTRTVEIDFDARTVGGPVLTRLIFF